MMNPVHSKPVLPDITAGLTGTCHLLKQDLLDTSISIGLPGLEVAHGVKIVISPPDPDGVDDQGRMLFQKIRLPAFGPVLLVEYRYDRSGCCQVPVTSGQV